jgi:hypothetical protein
MQYYKSQVRTPNENKFCTETSPTNSNHSLYLDVPNLYVLIQTGRMLVDPLYQSRRVARERESSHQQPKLKALTLGRSNETLPCLFIFNEVTPSE